MGEHGALKSLNELIDRVREIHSPRQLSDGLDKLVRSSGFHTFTHVGLRGLSYQEETAPYVTSVRADWETHYRNRQLEQRDPAIHRCLTGTTPVNFSDFHFSNLPSEQQQMMGEARDFRMEKGVCIPVHGPNNSLSILAVFHDGSDQTFADAARSIPFLALAAMHVHEQLLKLGSAPVPPPTTLTPREIECLLWSAEGKTAWEISRIIGVSERTVKFHIMNVMKKLGVHSRTHAVARAISLGLAQP